MAAKIPVNVHVGVVLLAVPEAQTYAGLRVTITGESGPAQSEVISASVAPTSDESGNAAYVVSFVDVQSGEDVHIEVTALDSDGFIMGLPVTHDTHLEAVPDEEVPTYYAPQSIFVSTGS